MLSATSIAIFVLSGMATQFVTSSCTAASDRFNVILPGDVIGFPVSFFDRSIYSVVALSDLTYNICSLNSYVSLCYEQPQFGLVLSWLAAHEAAIYAEHIVDLGRRTPVERLAHFLLGTIARLLNVGRAKAASFDLPFRRKSWPTSWG